MSGLKISLFALAGIALSLYAMYVEMMKNRDPGYVAACDLGGIFSCSKVFTSEYGHMANNFFPEEHILNKPNTYFGVFYYGCIILSQLPFLPFAQLRHALALFSTSLVLVFTLYLAYILAFVLHDFCIICASTYVSNVSIMYLLLRKNNSRKGQKSHDQ